MSWILLRGLTREARHWGGFVPQFTAKLAAHGKAEAVITLDLPGSGEFKDIRSPATVAKVVDFLRQQLKAKNILPPYKLLAMSLGGMVAASWAQDHGAEVSRLVLINTSMRPHGSMGQRLKPTNWPALVQLAARWQDGPAAEALIHRLTCQQLDTRRADIDAWLHIRQSAPVSRSNALRQLAAAARFSCSPATPACPVLVLSSTADRLVDSACSILLAKAWHVSHIQHPWAGHDLAHDDEDWVLQQVQAKL